MKKQTYGYGPHLMLDLSDSFFAFDLEPHEGEKKDVL
jgi:hypothetical protein